VPTPRLGRGLYPSRVRKASVSSRFGSTAVWALVMLRVGRGSVGEKPLSPENAAAIAQVRERSLRLRNRVRVFDHQQTIVFG
jgi:hypothetical protein